MSEVGNEGDGLVLVTGGAGFIGSHTVDRLVDEDYRVLVVDDFSSGKRDNLAQWEGDPRVEIIEASIVDGLFAPLAEPTRRLGPVTRIVHLAAQVSVVYSVANPLEDVRTNFAGTFQVLEYARVSGVRRVTFASSSAIYADDGSFPTGEDSPPGPLSPYGVNKLSSEHALDYYARTADLPGIALRFFNVYGPRQDPGSPYSGVISIFASRASRGEPLGVYGDGEQTRDFVYVGDVARAIVAACGSDRRGFTALNIGTGTELSINELARLVNELKGSPGGIRHLPPRAGDARRSVAAVVAAMDVLGFRAEVGIEEGLGRTLDHI